MINSRVIISKNMSGIYIPIIERLPNNEIGTTIKIHMHDFAVEYFKNKFGQEEWLNWYHFDESEITIRFNGELLERRLIIDKDDAKCCWHETKNTCFDELLWSFTPKFLTRNKRGNEYYKEYNYEVILNGIHIMRFLKPFERDDTYNNFEASSVCVRYMTSAGHIFHLILP